MITTFFSKYVLPILYFSHCGPVIGYGMWTISYFDLNYFNQRYSGFCFFFFFNLKVKMYFFLYVNTGECYSSEHEGSYFHMKLILQRAE